MNLAHRLLIGTALAFGGGLLSGISPPALAQGQSAAQVFDIPAQPLGAALDSFSRSAGWQVGYPAGLVQGKSAPAVSGRFSPGETLSRLLAGSGLTYRPSGAASVTLVQMSGADGAVQLPPVTVEGEGRRLETATSPVEGYVATRGRTATKTDTPLLETAQSISVIPRDQITDQNAQTLNQILRYTAGVTPETRGAVATRYDMFTIRGFNADKYWNGLKQQDLYYIAPQLDPYLLERVEVLKGPNSTLYGQAAAGGLVNQVSKRPLDSPLNEVGFETGTNNHYRLTTDFSNRLDAEGKFLYRLTAVGLTEDGQIEMTENERVALAPSFAWRPDEDTSLTLFGLYQSEPEGNSYGGIPPQGTVLSSPFGRLPMDFYDGDPNFEKFVRHQSALGYEFDKRLTDIWSFRSNARVQHTTLAYDSVYANGVQADGRTLNRGTATSREASTHYALDNQVEARFDTGPVQHTALAGLDYQTMRGHYATGFGSAPTLDIFNPVYGQTITAPTRSRTNLDALQYGLYLQDQLKLGGFVVTLGGRHDTAEQTTVTANTGAQQKTRDKAWTGKIGVLYAFDNGIAPYVSYSEAFTPQTGTDRLSRPFKPEEGEQYEAGLKYQPPGSDSIYTAALFEVTRTNVKTPDPVNANFSIQTGEARSRGFEAEARHSLNEQIDLIGAYTYIDAEVTKDTNAAAIGRQLGAVPEHQASAWVIYHLPRETSLKGLSVGGGVRYIGETQNPDNTLTVPDFTLFDAALNYDLGALSDRFSGVDFTLNVKNLLDEEYVASCYYGTWCAYGYERTITAGLRYRW